VENLVLTKPETIQSPVCESRFLNVSKRGVRVENRVSGQPEKHNSLPKLIRKQGAATKTSRLQYRPTKDGNVFAWILFTAEVVRQVRRMERDVIEKAAAESKRLDEAEVEN
jgi:hypothetical protein